LRLLLQVLGPYYYQSSRPLVFLIRNEQAIAVHTFCVLVLRWRAPKYISKLVVLSIWGFTALVVGVPYSFHRNEWFYGEAGYCKSFILWL
jgi:hypothetical protein